MSQLVGNHEDRFSPVAVQIRLTFFFVDMSRSRSANRYPSTLLNIDGSAYSLCMLIASSIETLGLPCSDVSHIECLGLTTSWTSARTSLGVLDYKMSRIMRKADFCIKENKDIDQLCSTWVLIITAGS